MGRKKNKKKSKSSDLPLNDSKSKKNAQTSEWQETTNPTNIESLCPENDAKQVSLNENVDICGHASTVSSSEINIDIDMAEKRDNKKIKSISHESKKKDKYPNDYGVASKSNMQNSGSKNINTKNDSHQKSGCIENNKKYENKNDIRRYLSPQGSSNQSNKREYSDNQNTKGEQKYKQDSCESGGGRFNKGTSSNRIPSRSRNNSEYQGETDDKYRNFAKIYIDNDKDMDYQVVQEIFGDLFMANDEYSLGHCVAEDMSMGSGIAVGFRQTFKRVEELLDQRKRQGQVAVLEDKQRYIYYLVTKRISSGKPTHYSLWSSLQRMKDHIIRYDVKKLALPRIGCGLDRLEWKYVKRMLEYTFHNVDIEIKIYHFDQDSDVHAPPSLPPALPKVRKCHVVNVSYPISEIEYGTIIVYFGSEDGYETEELKTINKKYPYIGNSYKTEERQVGKYIYAEKKAIGYLFYGCIVRGKYTDPFNFTYFQKCLKSIQAENRKNRYEYIAFQAFVEDGDEMTVFKIVNLMRHALTNVAVYVCWPENLHKFMPRNYDY